MSGERIRRPGARRVHAVILAGGRGTRLLPLTARHPKPLLPVAGVPVVVHQLRRLRAHGIGDVVVAVSHHGGQFEQVLGDGAVHGVRLRYAAEREPLGTGGGLANAARLLDPDPDDVIVVLNGDQLIEHDLRAQLEDFEVRRRQVGAIGSVHARSVPDARAFGLLRLDEDSRIIAFREKPAQRVPGTVNAGTYVLDPQAISAIRPGAAASLEHDVFPNLIADGRRVVAHVDQRCGADIGTPRSLVRASADLVLRRHGAALISADARVHPRAQLVGGSFVAAGAGVGAGAVVAGSMVLPGARVGAGAVLNGSILGPGATVGAGSRLDEAVIGDDAVVEDHAVLRTGARVGVGARVRAVPAAARLGHP